MRADGLFEHGKSLTEVIFGSVKATRGLKKNREVGEAHRHVFVLRSINAAPHSERVLIKFFGFRKATGALSHVREIAQSGSNIAMRSAKGSATNCESLTVERLGFAKTLTIGQQICQLIQRLRCVGMAISQSPNTHVQ